MQHHLAIQALVSGATDAQAAELASVHRVTVTHWHLYHPTFKAELNRRRVQAIEAATDALRTLLPGALVALADQLRIGEQRGRLAVDVLHRAGLFTAVSLGATGPTEAQDFVDQELRRRRATDGTEGNDASDATAPITDEEREAVFIELVAQAEQAPPDASSPDEAAGDPDHSARRPAHRTALTFAALPAILPFSAERTPAIDEAPSPNAASTSRRRGFS